MRTAAKRNVLQVCVTDEMKTAVINEAIRLGLSNSSYLEMVIGKHLCTVESQSFYKEMKI